MTQNSNVKQTADTLNLVGQIGCVIGLVAVVIIAAAFGVGWVIDEWMGNERKVVTILLMIGSFPITLWAMIQISIRTLARANAKAEENNKAEDLDKDK